MAASARGRGYVDLQVPISPVEELLTQKVTRLYVRVILSNHKAGEKREWFWTPEYFYDRVGGMRAAFQDFQVNQTLPPKHVAHDPFWSPPGVQSIGDAYLYLAPIAYGVALEQWIPIHNYRGEEVGELNLVLKPKTKPTEDPNGLLGHFASSELVYVQAPRALVADSPITKVFLQFTFGDEAYTRQTAVGQGSTTAPMWPAESHELVLISLTEVDVDYLSKDALCLRVLAETEDVAEVDKRVGEATRSTGPSLVRSESLVDHVREARRVMEDSDDHLDQLKRRLIEDVKQQYAMLSLRGAAHDLELEDALGLWQLPNVETPSVEKMEEVEEPIPDDVEALMALVRELRAKLKDSQAELTRERELYQMNAAGTARVKKSPTKPLNSSSSQAYLYTGVVPSAQVLPHGGQPPPPKKGGGCAIS